MLVLIRKVRVRGDQIIDQRDVEFSADSIRVGSDEDQDLQLFGREIGAEHALLRPQPDGTLRIDCRGARQLTLDGREVGHAVVAPGEWVQIGPHRLVPARAPPGFDAAIEVRVDADVEPTIAERLRRDLALKLPRVRRWTYALVLLVLLPGLVIPMSAYYHGDVEQTIQRYGGPSDQLWATGPLARAHQLPLLAENCKACHVKPFQRVRDDACLACHQDTPHHFGFVHPAAEEFRGDCRSCHKEHNQPSTLVMQRDALCTDCHQQEHQRLLEAAAPVGPRPVTAAPATVPVVSAFSREGHPEFLASLLSLEGDGWEIHRQRLDSPGLAEASHLKFPHDLHLDGDKVSLADTATRGPRALVCADCHQLQHDGEHFRPVTMEATCAGCHSLAFDDAQPARQLPHGDPSALRIYLEEYHIREAAQTEARPVSAAPRTVPGVTGEGRRCDDTPLNCGRQRAAEQMEHLFTRAGCVSCHTVYRDQDQWQVKPVRLATDWFSGARFDHRPHLNPGIMGPGNMGKGEVCLTCHQAQHSSQSSDVLMPGIAVCLDCHGAKRGGGVLLHCVDCHDFHRAGLPVMGGAWTGR